MSIILIDTNVLIYAYDQNDLPRQERALNVLKQLDLTGAGRLSVQSLSEFSTVAMRKLKPPLTPAETLEQIEQLAEAYLVLDLTPAIVMEAVRGVRDHRLSYYDAQIWATAKLNQIPIIFSEDFASGSSLESVRFINPFAAEFVLEAWA